MTSRNDATAPFLRIREHVERILAEHGLSVKDVVFSADEVPTIHIRTRVTDLDTGDGFDQVIADAEAAEAEHRAEEARGALQQDIAEWFE